MNKKLVKVGNSMYFNITKMLREILGVTDEVKFEIEKDKIILSKPDEKEGKEKKKGG
jgi:antitoxin component of MazEF toxin-antitoxin module